MQFSVSNVNVCSSLYLIATLYELIAEPPLNGATQLIVTLTLEFTAVVGACGTLGMAAALMATEDESGPRPTMLRAVTLKV